MIRCCMKCKQKFYDVTNNNIVCPECVAHNNFGGDVYG
jgi:hypothetical protein